MIPIIDTADADELATLAIVSVATMPVLIIFTVLLTTPKPTAFAMIGAIFVVCTEINEPDSTGPSVISD